MVIRQMMTQYTVEGVDHPVLDDTEKRLLPDDTETTYQTGDDTVYSGRAKRYSGVYTI